VRIGRISYLWHLPIYGFVFKYGWFWQGSVQSAAAVGLSLAVAVLSYRYIERPFLRFKPPTRGNDSFRPATSGVADEDSGAAATVGSAAYFRGPSPW
jgi:peptidoglycan/LPS O-acetylase OafA/YrhL